MLRMEIACICVVLFIAAMFLGGKREWTRLRCIYAMILVSITIHLCFDAITVYTVNHMFTVESKYNNLFHRLYIGTMLITLYLFERYITGIIEEEVKGLRTSKNHKIVSILGIAFVSISLILVTFLKTTYVKTKAGNYLSGHLAIIMYIAAPLFIIYVIYMMIVYRRQIHKNKKYAIYVAILTEAIVLIIMMIIPTSLLSGMGMTLMTLAFYMMLENPDIELLEEARKERQRADDANEAKSSFLANMSHEIRTPMNAIVGMTDILLRTELNDQQKNYLYNIKNSGNSLLLIINDLLDFSKIEAGKMELVEDEYNPMSIFNDVSMIILNRIGDKPIELLFDVEKDLPSRLLGDSGRIKQIIINLMNNAVKFTEEGHVTLSVKMGEPEGDDVMLYFSVEDSGQGIRKEDLSKLFNAFEQVDMKRNRNKEGTGLGLSICKQLTSLMGGEISVDSEYGVGSRFDFCIKQKIIEREPAVSVKDNIDDVEGTKIGAYVCGELEGNLKKTVEAFGYTYISLSAENLETASVNHLFVDEDLYETCKDKIHVLCDKGADVAILVNPMKNSVVDNRVKVIFKPVYTSAFCKFINHEEATDDYAALDEAISFTAEKAKVLIVDDNDMNLKVASGLFGPLKMNLQTARSGKEALSFIEKTRYDIIFMDHMMPVMDGIETISRIRNSEVFDGYYKEADIVALTANAGEEAKAAFKSVGVTEFLAKPIDMKYAIRIIKKLLPEDMLEKAKSPVINDIAKSIENLPSIEGLNVAEGVKNSGSLQFLESLLGDFYKLIDMKSSKIEKCYNDNMLHDFTIEVHALKNTARMIGASELSQMFLEMENLGNAEKGEEIGKLLPQLLEKYRSYKPILKPYAEKNDSEKEDVAPEKIIEALDDMVEAIDNFDLDRADADMEFLEKVKVDVACGPLMENLRAYVADVAMDDIVKTASEIKDIILKK